MKTKDDNLPGTSASDGKEHPPSTPMFDGYYWYVPATPEGVPDLEDEPRVVMVYRGDTVAVCGSDVTHDISECKGRFIGPLEPPK